MAEPLPAQACSCWAGGPCRRKRVAAWERPRRAERLPLLIQRTSWRGVASADCSSGLQQAMGERRGAAMARI